MIKILLIIASAILIGLVITYSWFNRDSDRVVLTLITAMFIGSIGFITKESISNKLEKSNISFPIAVFYGLPDYRPLKIKLPYSFDLGMCVQNLNVSDLPATSSETIDISFGSEIYFQAIEWSIIKSIFEKFSNGWNVQVRKVKTPGGTQLSWSNTKEKGDVYTIKDFSVNFPRNRFIDLGLLSDMPKGLGGQITLPPNTSIQVTSNNDPEKLNQRTILLKTQYVTLTISLNTSTSTIGMGEYSPLLGIPSAMDRRNAGGEADKVAYSVYLLNIDIEQNYWLNGHPKMKSHREWANSISELLYNRFSYEHIHSEHMKQFQLHGVEGIVSPI